MADSEKILVATSAAHLPESLSRAPHLTGVLEWRFEGTGLYAVIVKTRVPFSERDALVRPEVMIATPVQSETLGRPNDFVPSKPWVDVMLTGAFYITSKDGEPVRATGRLVLGEEETPLVIESATGGRIPVGPSNVRVPTGAKAHVGINNPLDPAELAFDHPDDFPFEAYTFSHPALGRSLGTLKEGLEFYLKLEPPHRVDDQNYFTAHLPTRSPRVLVDAQDGDEKSRVQPLYLDTVVLDLEKQEMELTWRGSWFRQDDPSEIDRVLIGWASEAEWEDEGFAGLYKEMAWGFFEWAHVYEETKDGKAPPPLDEDELEGAMYDTLDSPLAPAPRRSLEEFAKIQTELNEARESRADIFKKHKTSEFHFALESRAWTEKMMDESLANPIEAPLATRYAKAMKLESDSYARPHEAERTLRHYAEVKHKMSAGDPTKVLKHEKISLGEWIRWDRQTMTRLQGSPRAAEELEAHLSELRAADAQASRDRAETTGGKP